jgi:large subunit ribosomal protein L28
MPGADGFSLTIPLALDYMRASRTESDLRASSFHCRSPDFPEAKIRILNMSRVCELTGVGPMVGHNVSHSNIKTKRRFLPSLAQINLPSDALGQSFKLKITNAALRTLDFRGGLDNVLMNSRDDVLSPKALKIKRQVKAKLAGQTAAA